MLPAPGLGSGKASRDLDYPGFSDVVWVRSSSSGTGMPNLILNQGCLIRQFLPSTAFLRSKKAKGWLGMVGSWGQG
jgi:hypothetical protein